MIAGRATFVGVPRAAGRRLAVMSGLQRNAVTAAKQRRRPGLARLPRMKLRSATAGSHVHGANRPDLTPPRPRRARVPPVSATKPVATTKPTPGIAVGTSTRRDSSESVRGLGVSTSNTPVCLPICASRIERRLLLRQTSPPIRRTPPRTSLSSPPAATPYVHPASPKAFQSGQPMCCSSGQTMC